MKRIALAPLSLAALLLLAPSISMADSTFFRPPPRPATRPRPPASPAAASAGTDGASSQNLTTDTAPAPAPITPLPPEFDMSRLDPTTRAQAMAAGCVPGAKVATPHAATFYPAEGGRTLVADIGEHFDVDRENPVAGDRCNVHGSSLGGEPFSGSVAMGDLRPEAAVRAQLAARAFNQVQAINISALPDELRRAMAARAQSLGLDTSGYGDVIDTIVRTAALCSEISQEDVDRNNDVELRTRVPTGFRDRYHPCFTEIMGSKIGGSPREVMLAIQLRSTKWNQRYKVLVQFARVPELDAGRQLHPETVSEAFLDYYDVYGVGNYYVQ